MNEQYTDLSATWLKIQISLGDAGNMTLQNGWECFVDAAAVAAFLSISRAEVLRLTRQGKIRGYAYKGSVRHVYRYLLSEISEDFAKFAYQPKVQSATQPL